MCVAGWLLYATKLRNQSILTENSPLIIAIANSGRSYLNVVGLQTEGTIQIMMQFGECHVCMWNSVHLQTQLSLVDCSGS